MPICKTEAKAFSELYERVTAPHRPQPFRVVDNGQKIHAMKMAILKSFDSSGTVLTEEERTALENCETHQEINTIAMSIQDSMKGRPRVTTKENYEAYHEDMDKRQREKFDRKLNEKLVSKRRKRQIELAEHVNRLEIMEENVSHR